MLYKISYYSFYLPVALAVYMSHVPQSHPSGNQAIEPYASLNPSSSPSASIIIQDDFLDQIGTDILDNKCSWGVNTALTLCTPEQRRVLDENYGKKDLECERKVKVCGI